MRVSAEHPLALISTACGIAEYNVFLSDELPFYVRKGNWVWEGYFSDGHVVKSHSTRQLYKDCLKYWREKHAEQETP